MATVVLTSSSWSPGRLRVTYSASNGNVTITELEGCRTDSYTSGYTTDKTVTVKVGSSSKSVSLSKYINFTKSSSYTTWGATDTPWSGLSGNSVSISVTMPSSSGAYSGKVFSGSLSMSWSTYTITYNANGGTGAPSNQTKTYGTNLTLSSTVPTRESVVDGATIKHYVFKGWATSATATSPTYQPSGSYTSNAAATLYAVWEEVIEVIAIMGKPTVLKLATTQNTAKFRLIEPPEYNDGATFGSWEVTTTSGKHYVSGDNILTVKWDKNETILGYIRVVDSKGYKSEPVEVVCNVRKNGFCVYDKGRWKKVSPYIYRDGEYKRLNGAVYNEDGTWFKYYCRGTEVTYLTDASGDFLTDESGNVLRT